jgi:hypothetical protein
MPNARWTTPLSALAVILILPAPGAPSAFGPAIEAVSHTVSSAGHDVGYSVPTTALTQSADSTSHTTGVTVAAIGTDSVTRTLMRNVDFYVDPEVVLRIRTLRGTMRSKAGGPVVFDDKRSFILHIDTADVGLDAHDLTALMNKYIFGYNGAPIKKVSVTIAGGAMRMTGRLHKGVDIPFDISAQVSATPDGKMRVHPTKTKIFGVDGDALMRALHLSLEKMIDVSKAVGVTVHENDILIDPTKVLPPPAIEGHVTRVRVEGDQVVQTFGSEPGTRAVASQPVLPVLTAPDTSARNFMYYRGGSLRFGRLTMTDADMQIVDLDPKDPFEFELDLYARQLVAGYSRTTPSMGLEVYMRDIDKIGRAGSAVEPKH